MIGKREQDAKQYIEAIDNYDASLKIGTTAYGLLGFVYGNMGLAYFALEKFDQVCQLKRVF